MKILIVGLPGTGKTTFAKMFAEKHHFQIISDWDIFAKMNIKIEKLKDKNIISTQYSKLLLDHINSLEGNFIVDLEYSISPNDFIRYNTDNSVKIVYLGFSTLDNNTLFDLFRKSESNQKYSDNQLISQIESYKEISKQYLQQCKQNGLKFFDINKDRKEIMKDIFSYLNL